MKECRSKATQPVTAPRIAGLAVLLASGLLTACGDASGPDIDDTDLEPLPTVADIEFAAIQPAMAWDYWELRHTFQGQGDPAEIVGAGGSMSRSELPPETVAALDAAEPIHGFATACLPAHCFDYILAVDDGVITVVSTTADLRSFLGDLGTFPEAVLMVHALGFWWSPTEPGTGYRERANDGWEFVVLQLVKACAPVRTDRVVLRIEATRPVTEVGREVWRSDENVCI